MIQRSDIVNTEQADCVFYACETQGDFDLTYVSRSITGLFGYPVDFCLTTHAFWSDRIHPDDKGKVFGEIGKLFEAGNFAHSYRFRHEDGRYIKVRDELVLIVDAQGAPKEIVGKMIPVGPLAQLS